MNQINILDRGKKVNSLRDTSLECLHISSAFLMLFIHGHKSGVEGGRINSIHPNLSSLPTHRSPGQSPASCTELSENNNKLHTEPHRPVADHSRSWVLLVRLKYLVPTEKKVICHWGMQSVQYSGFSQQ